MVSDTTEQLTHIHIDVCGASHVAQWKRIPPAMQETWIPSLDREDPLEEGMATHLGSGLRLGGLGDSLRKLGHSRLGAVQNGRSSFTSDYLSNSIY